MVKILSSPLKLPKDFPLCSLSNLETTSSHQICLAARVDPPTSRCSTLEIKFLVTKFPLLALPFIINSPKSTSIFSFFNFGLGLNLISTVSLLPFGLLRNNVFWDL